ncbi:double-stranded RNA binding motif-containing protein [Tupanvirus soda lake]|uniref:Double-stranded RNA binding motif-containing protein n=2 Tax=Tupanvirus TaxID=2094720 RepID=A0A6N1NWH7_9VIRU|nr:double-stranded RNA binding motif-containing protein [Tupanvirus soda lake]QKU35583.1 double-stranded RNA binding motif-containing protein [Tupanvirus soda lake]
MSEKNRLQEYCQKNKIPMPVYQSWSSGEPHKLQWSASVTIITGKKNITMNTIVPSICKTAAEKQAAYMMLDHLKSKKNNDPNSVSQISKLKERVKHDIITSHKAMFPSKLIDNEEEYIEIENSESSTNTDTEDDTNNVLVVSDSDDENKDDKPYSINQIYLTDSDNEQVNFKSIYLIDLENKPSFRCKFKNNCLYIGFINSIHHSLVKYNGWHKCRSDNLLHEITLSENNKLIYLIDGGTVDLVDHFMTAFVYPVVEYIKEIDGTPSVHIISGDHAGWCTRACLEKILKWRKMNIDVNNSAVID